MADSPEKAIAKIKKRIGDAKDTQKSFHGTWATNLAFAKGQQWLVWDKQARTLRSISEVDYRYEQRELFTADRIREYKESALGELTSEDDRPELLVAQDGDEAEAVADRLNKVAGYAWDHEWYSDEALLRCRSLVLDLGVAAIRCRFDPDAGEVVGHQPYGADGQPADEASMEATGQTQDGSLPTYKPVKSGRTCWEPYSAFQILTPPGVVHEKDFPWEALMRPVPVDEINATYGVTVQEDTDIASGIGLPSALSSQSGQQANRLRDHAWLYTYFDRPCAQYPQGRTVIMAGPNMDIVHEDESLPYTLNGQPHSGVVYFHWWRLTDQFHSRSLIEPLRDPQRIINRRVTQNVEIIDRAMPRTFVHDGDLVDEMTGQPHEIVRMSPQASAPTFWPGSGPGSFMYQDIATWDDALSHASTMAPLRLGENPQQVQTYGQLALLNDNEHGKRQTIVAQHRQAIADLMQLSLSDIKKYWPQQKQVQVFGDEDRLQTAVFQKSDVPDLFRVKVAKGQPLPRSQGAEVKKVDAIFAAMVQTGMAQGDPVAATSWYKDSLEAGEAQALPSQAPNSQQKLAQLENMLMRQGINVTPTYYDNMQIHVPIHREEEDQARAEGDAELAARIEQHILAHDQAAQAGAMLANAHGPAPGTAPPAEAGGPQDQGGGGGGGAPPIPAFVNRDFQTMASGQ